MSPAVGKDIESICGKCGDVWHVVVAKVGEQVVKVQCKQCGGYHRYRPPQKAKGASSVARREPGQSTPRASGGGSAARAPKPPPGPQVQADPLRPIKIYKPHFTFAVADTLDHPTFGRGIVEALPNPERIQVWFDGERRVLVHARSSTGAAAPTHAPPLPERRRGDDGEE